MVTCPTCGKRYSSTDEECPDCAKGAPAEMKDAESIFDEETKKATKLSDTAEIIESEKTDSSDIEKWLKGGEQEFPAVSDSQSTPWSQEETSKEPQQGENGGIIEAWLKGKVDDISTWLSGDVTTSVPMEEEEISAPEAEDRAELEKAQSGLKKLIDDFRTGKVGAEQIAKEAYTILSDLHSLRVENSKLKDELDSVRKGSTALAKYFKSVQGKEEGESDKLTDQLAKEMAAREQLEIENMELRASAQTLRDQFEKGLQQLPPEQQDVARIQTELAEKSRMLDEMQNLIKCKETEHVKEESEAKVEMRERFASELQDRIADFEHSNTALKNEVEKLTYRNRELEVSLSQKKEEIQLLSSAKSSGGSINTALRERLEDTQRIERELALRNQEVGVLKQKLIDKDDEMKALKEPMRFKEDELLRREEDMLHRERLMEEQIKRLEQAKAEFGSHEEIDLKKRLEQLQADVTAKEEEIKAKEKFISAKEEDLKLREKGVISQEIDRREEERTLEFKIEKVKTGTMRLDDLLMGGLPFGSNVLVYGPPFMGKEVLVNGFVAEGLKKGIPVVWVTTEKTPAELREEMKFVQSGFEEYEKLGLVKFVDSYSRSMGDTSNDPNVIYIDSPTDFQAIQNGVEKAGKELLEKHKYYRFVFRSISTMIAYLDPATAFRFLNPIVGRRKRDKAVSMLIIEKGMHGDQEIQMVGSLMDGMIEFKVENLNTFLSVKGIGDVQSRAWIRYTSTKSAVNIGSFALDHIR
jgi:KaiC/GvpD/RAD55 family RecA-like ATPase